MQRLAILLALFVGLGPSLLAGCKKESECETACLRVARCRLAARQGEPMLGEQAPPADARCMKRCQDDHEAFAKCELIKRNCDSLRSCYGPLR